MGVEALAQVLAGCCLVLAALRLDAAKTSTSLSILTIRSRLISPGPTGTRRMAVAEGRVTPVRLRTAGGAGDALTPRPDPSRSTGPYRQVVPWAVLLPVLGRAVP